jgi:hypothetical protein
LPQESQKSAEGSKETIKEQHDLVDEIIKDPNQIANITNFIGYRGKSNSEGVIRLYTSLEFNEYIEIKKEDIAAMRNVNDDVILFGGTAIFVDNTCEIKRVRIDTTKQQAMFLSGKVSESFITSTTGAHETPIEPKSVTQKTTYDSSEQRAHFNYDDMISARPAQTRSSRTCCTA